MSEVWAGSRERACGAKTATVDNDRLDRTVTYGGVGWAQPRGAVTKGMPVTLQTSLFYNYMGLYMHHGSFLADGGEAS